MSPKKKDDINNDDDKDLDDKSKDNDSDDGDGENGDDDGNGDDKGLTKEDIQTEVKSAIAEAVKEIITPEIDRRISGVTKTIYKKVGINEDDKDDSKNKDADLKAAKLKDRFEIASVYAETTIKEETGKLGEEEQGLIETLIGFEISKFEIEDGQTVKDMGKIIGTNVLKKYNKIKEKIETKQIDALKKAGQVIDIKEPGRKDSKVNEFDKGKKMAEKRHPKKKE